MALIPSTCERCGGSLTFKKADGIPTCRPCLLKLRAQREPPRACPRDDLPMEKLVIKGVIVDRCTTCGGVWLDKGELQLLQSAAAREERDGFASGVILGAILG